MQGGTQQQIRVMDDGSVADPQEKNLASFRYSKSILSLNVGFDPYRSVGYGFSSFCLLVDLVLRSGYLTLPALFIAAGEIVNDFSDFLVAVVLIGRNVGFYPAAAYGCTYLTLLVIESLLWLGTCKYHKHCQTDNANRQMLEKFQMKVVSAKRTGA
ncbi:UNVERIFIED_CONTAM: hypothetical protein PYX00_000300 [Menopon gallinae]|uniref:Uncharacterized protein n=1 Tax=Menopon gallinae TaxID=328185 RepID=A0AAW2I8F7_9NEOP